VLETPHVVVGAAIATKVVNPVLALPLSFASHFVLEKIPHWNPHLNTEVKKHGKPTRQSTYIVILDAAIALTTGVYIASRALPNINHVVVILAASFFAVLPDVVEAPYFFLNIRNLYIKKWIALQKSLQVDSEVLPGLITQAIVILASFWWIAD
jgi:hypothetical protein